jgi:hypothetical protein
MSFPFLGVFGAEIFAYGRWRRNAYSPAQVIKPGGRTMETMRAIRVTEIGDGRRWSGSRLPVSISPMETRGSVGKLLLEVADV